eukprot:NODE_646_length_2015_cov_40.747711_g597_i0.p1 GENE.NODE_646_length_2015_cov_40.747711_g597_i0~~NODE_646_length_2015_cov_40.747711_g597_i0.p1  ORF type:complete len:568 (-),score=65.04 NODE_646_length_2015_cov_40.747711_g597_i0:208-1911(-)
MAFRRLAAKSALSVPRHVSSSFAPAALVLEVVVMASWMTAVVDATEAEAIRSAFPGVTTFPGDNDPCSWTGIVCNAGGAVTEINFVELGYSGGVDLPSLSALTSLEVLDLRQNSFTGTVDLTSLPSSLFDLRLNVNDFTGTVDLTSLPGSLEKLYVRDTELTGTVDLTSLPSSLQDLYLDRNNFTGSVDLTSLPSLMLEIRLNGNDLSGSADLTSLPSSMLEIRLDGNSFSGSVDLTSLPNGLERLDLHSNAFTGTLDQTGLPSSLTALTIGGNRWGCPAPVNAVSPGEAVTCVTATDTSTESTSVTGLRTGTATATGSGTTTGSGSDSTTISVTGLRTGTATATATGSGTATGSASDSATDTSTGLRTDTAPATGSGTSTGSGSDSATSLAGSFSSAVSATRTPAVVAVSFYPAARSLPYPRGSFNVQIRNPVGAEYRVSLSASSDCEQLFGTVVKGSEESRVLTLAVDDIERASTICVSFSGARFSRLPTYACPLGSDYDQCVSGGSTTIPQHLQPCNRGGEEYGQICWCYEGTGDIYCHYKYKEPWMGQGPSSLAEWRKMRARV